MEIIMQKINIKEEAGWTKGKRWEDNKGYFSCEARKAEKRSLSSYNKQTTKSKE